MKKEIANESFLDSLLKTPRVYGTKVSPNLEWVAWSWLNAGPVAEVYIAPINKSQPPRKLTSFGQDTLILSWTADSKSILISHDYDGDERCSLYKVDVEDGKTVQLINHPDFYLHGAEITPDGKYLIFGANYDFEKQVETNPTFVYKKGLETGEIFKLSNSTKACYLIPQLNKQGTLILFQKKELNVHGQQIWIVDIDGKEEKEVLNFGDSIFVSAIWHQNGEEIVFIVEQDNYRKLGLFSVKTSSIRWLIDDKSRNIESVYTLMGSELLAVEEAIESQSSVSLFDTKTMKEELFSSLQTIFPLAQLPNNLWLSRQYNSQQPQQLIIHDRQDKILRTVANPFSFINYTKDALQKAENYSWKSVDGLNIQGWLYKSTIKQVGTIILVHGGPTSHYDNSFNADIQYFVSQGFNVLCPNYRGSTGFGLGFSNLVKRDGWGGIEQLDILEGIKSLIKDGLAEPFKIGVTGTSYGGYSSWCAITRYEPKYVRASIPICAITDVKTDFNTTRPDRVTYTQRMMDGTPEEVPDKYFNSSPMNFIKNIKGDLLIVHGTKDPNVTIDHVFLAEKELIHHNISYQKLLFEDEGHLIYKPKNNKILFAKIASFFKKAFETKVGD